MKLNEGWEDSVEKRDHLQREKKTPFIQKKMGKLTRKKREIVGGGHMEEVSRKVVNYWGATKKWLLIHSFVKQASGCRMGHRFNWKKLLLKTFDYGKGLDFNQKINHYDKERTLSRKSIKNSTVWFSPARARWKKYESEKKFCLKK